MAKIDAEKVPLELKPFISYAEKWGEQDIDVREYLVENASIEEIHELEALWEFCVGVISNWLEEPQVRADPTTDEYIAFTCFILAVSSAKYRLKYLDK